MRETFVRRISTPEQESPIPVRNGIKSSLGDLQGVDLLRGFEKISSWREGGSPIKDHRDENKNTRESEEYGLGKELKVVEHERVNGNGVAKECPGDEMVREDPSVAELRVEEMDSQMTEVRAEGAKE